MSTFDENWQLGPFERRAQLTFGPNPTLSFQCPVARRPIAWAIKDVFNPGAIVRDGKVYLLIRAEDGEGRYAGTSRIGLAVSEDGLNFQLDSQPVLYPDDDQWQPWEWPGGCEDPRIVESPDGGYVCLYTAFDGKTASLFVATSDDLVSWQKHGPAFAYTNQVLRWSKSGSIVTEIVDGTLVAARIKGKYWMYWGEGTCFVATSDDLIRWQPVQHDPHADRYMTWGKGRRSLPWVIHGVEGPSVAQAVMWPRPGRFDSWAVEPGPPAVRTSDGIVLIYNGVNDPRIGDPATPPYSYQVSQVLFDAMDPTACIRRPDEPFMRPVLQAELSGQMPNVCFAQGLVLFERRWHLYFGMGDSGVGCAVSGIVAE